MKTLGQIKMENVFIRGTKRIQGTNKNGNEFDFVELKFDDETGEEYKLRLGEDVEADLFPIRTEGTLVLNVCCTHFKDSVTTYLQAVDFKQYKSK